VMQETIILLKAYAKNEQTDLSARQRKEILRFLEEFDHA
jgi:succinate dehydrogenase flavin-adding protein (antitoxin of CptAB toxin-antitoxin module)